ncbi:MAG: response regulator [Defluviitaleaceae bacterium]|nr:response regulator [Defluviitaleaceae bacterium]
MTNEILKRLMVYRCESNKLTFVSEGCTALTGYTELPADIRQKIEKFHEAASDLEVSFQISTKSGEKKIVLLRSCVLELNEDGDPHIIEGMVFDVTKLVQAESVRAENRAGFDFWERLDSGIRTPMNAILELSELASDMPAHVREYTRQIELSGKKLMQTMNNVFDYKKLERGEQELSEKKYEPAALIKELAQFTGELDSGLEFKLYADKDLPDELIGDAEKLRLVVQNLISNAVKFTETGYISLAIESKVVDDSLILEFSVEDTGRGIREEDKASIFMPFTQIKNTEGIGLGLAISKKTVELMGGELDFSSSYGAGSVFTVTVPQRVCTTEQPLAKKPRANFKNPNFIAPDARVLVVDAIKANLTVAEGFLRPYKMQVDLCESGLSAIVAVKARDYDLILMDRLMPEMTGEETAAAIRELGKNIPIVELAADEKYRGNMDDFLPKPIDAGELNAILENRIPQKKQIPAGETASASRTAPRLAKIKISGIDIKKGLTKTGGDADIYLRVLKEYSESGSRIVKELHFCVQRGDLKTYHVYTHAINSISDNIGASEISREAASLEKAAERGDLSFVAINNSAFTEKLSELIKNIHAAIKDEKISAPRVIESDDEKRKILLIDDTPSYLLFLSEILQDDYEPLTSVNAQDGIETARLTKPDLILLDIMMPEMSGYEALKALKADKELKHIPVILISGKEQKENEEKGRALGAVGYVKKPFDANIVKKKVAVVFA